jgi:hypothetical protein
MRMKLYRIVPLPHPELFIAAGDKSQAGEIFLDFTTWTGPLRYRHLQIERYDKLLRGERELGLNSLLERGVPGVAEYFDGGGWVLWPPGCGRAGRR